MRRWVQVWIVATGLLGCVNAQHAEVKLAGNPAGAECFATCVRSSSQDSAQTVTCVSHCPGAVQLDGNCERGGACVEHRSISQWKTWLIVIGGAVVFTAVARPS